MARALPIHDPGRVNLRKAIRAAVLAPALLAIGMGPLDDSTVGLFAAFAAFAVLVLADFGGEPLRRRFSDYVGLGVVGAFLIAIGTLVSGDIAAATLAMAVIAFVVLLAGVLGGATAAAGSPAILAFVLAATVPADASQAAPRAMAWLVAAIVSGAAAVLAWPRHERAALRAEAATALHAIAVAARSPGTAELEAAAHTAIDTLRVRAAGVLYRSSGHADRDQAMVAIVGGVIRARSFVDRLSRAPTPGAPDDTALRDIVADVLDAAAVTISGGSAADRPLPDLEGVERARVANRDELERWAASRLAAGAATDDVLQELNASFPLRVLSHVALSLAANAVLAVGGPVELGGLESTPVVDDAVADRHEAARRQRRALVRSHLTLRSASCRSALRGAAGFALAVLLATSLDVQHGFWVVLGAMVVLRSSALGTGANALRALAGVMAGFAAAVVVIAVSGGDTTVLWILLPITVFLAGYTPGAIHFVVGQAAFTVFVVVLFTIVAPEGFETAVVRVEDIALGAGVSVVVGLLFWPRGARSVFLGCLAMLYREAATHIRQAFALALGAHNEREVNEARDTAVISRRQADDAYAQFANERGAQALPVDAWASVLTATTKLRLTADAVVFYSNHDYVRRGCDAGADAIEAQVDAIAAGYERIAQRLDGASTDPLAVAEPAAVHTGISACLREHASGGPQDVASAFALVWMADWLRFLDHVLAILDEPTAQIAAIADRPWWR